LRPFGFYPPPGEGVPQKLAVMMTVYRTFFLIEFKPFSDELSSDVITIKAALIT